MSTEKSSSVKLKGVGDGLWITLDPSLSEDTIKKEIDILFKRMKNLAIGANVVLDVDGAQGHETLLDSLKGYLQDTYQVGRVSSSPEKRSAPVERIRQRDLSRGWNHHRSDVLMLRGRVRSGQKIETKGHLIITGNVNPGSELIAGKDIIVLGKLSGKVHAGYPDNESAMIFALAFNPTQVRIGNVTAAGVEDEAGTAPEFASVKDHAIVVEEFMKANPFGKLPWPETI
ncbi:MAG: septum site-determining protein MinC [Desulfobacteraceae bacterium]|nr:MAG: septum site-determining protein MinC [Desulfobacteraceae bacterium]